MPFLKERNEKNVGEEYCWAITQALGRHAAADKVTVCWSLDFKWTKVCIHIYLNTCILSSD
jgi:hypothetical protein